MAFPRQLLTPDEDLLLDLRPHWIVLLPRGVVVFLASMLLLVVLRHTNGVFATVLGWLVGAALLAASLRFAAVFLSWWFTSFAVTSERLIVRSGVISKNGVEIPLDRINTVFFSQRPLERLVGAGDLTIESASEKGRQTFQDVRRPSRVQEVIYRARENFDQRGRERAGEALGEHLSKHLHNVAAAGTQPSIVDQLERLARLREDGSVDEEEFTQLKRAILGSDLPPPPPQHSRVSRGPRPRT